jgi:hypothetical protein
MPALFPAGDIDPTVGEERLGRLRQLRGKLLKAASTISLGEGTCRHSVPSGA